LAKIREMGRKSRGNTAVCVSHVEVLLGISHTIYLSTYRSRNVYERALDVDYKNVTVWLKYAEMEMKNKNVNHARNLWDRAVTLLPRVNQFWYKFIYMEDILGNYAGARQIFERWMEWEPDDHAWNSYIKFEMRNGETERARTIFKRFVHVHTT